jgi:hypothetical protein
MHFLRYTAAWLALGLGIVAAAPQPLTIRNDSFEEQKDSLNGDGDATPIGNDPGDYTLANVPQWTAVGAGLFHPDTPLDFAPDGDLVAFVDNGGSIAQPLFFPDGRPLTALPGMRLTLSAHARGRSGGQPATTITLRSGNTALANPVSLPISANSTGYTPTEASISLPDSLPAGTANGPVTLVIASSGQQLNIDRVAAAVSFPPVITAFSASPQPATAGEALSVTWSVEGADSVTLDGRDVTGFASSTLTAPSAPQTLRLTASNGDGTAGRDLRIEVLPAPLPPPPVRLTEALTDNTSGLRDEDGTLQDWIELENPTGQSVLLAGWHLSDDPTNPRKWTFPNVAAPAGGRFIVFASGKNRSKFPLHTNFRLSNAGETVVLSDPEGRPVSRLEIPVLPANRAFGLGFGPSGGTLSLLSPATPVRWLAPTGAVDPAWRGGAAFDDSTWATGSWSFGFSETTVTAYGVPAGTVGSQTYSGALGMDFDVLRPITVTELGCFDSSANGLSRTITVVLWSRRDNGSPANAADDTAGSVMASEVFTTASPGTLTGTQRFKPLAAPVVLLPGAYTMVAYNYGSGEPNGNNAAFLNSVNAGSGALAFVGTSRYGSATPPASPAASWPGSPDGGPAARYAAGTFRFRESAPVNTSTSAAMLGRTASLLTRAPFTIPPSQMPPQATLTITADDGFAAWLNGTAIARRNAPPDPGFDSTATVADRFTASFSVPADVFREGSNVLAIHGLNVSAGDPDFSLAASLTAPETREIAGFLTAPTPGQPNAPAFAALGPVITEIHSDPPDSKSRFTEFIEIFNPTPETVDLSQWSLTGGIRFSFPPGTMLAPGAWIVVAENPGHLQSFLGYPNALGPWSGNLANEGDEIVLRRADLSVADRVSYELGFPWPTVGDDPGASLQLISERLDRSLGGSWRSALPTPGSRNAVAAGTAPPAIRRVSHAPTAPSSGQAVTVSATVSDPDGISAVWLEFQTVDPGQYLRLSDPAYLTRWETLAMNDDGADGDAQAGDSVFTVTIPAEIQQHRRLVRYRIRAWDGQLAAVRVPYADDPVPNFAWFCYDGVPAWTAAVRPGVTPAETFPATTMQRVRPWHLLSHADDVQNCQYNPAVNDGTYRFPGTLVIGDRVYDHVRYRVKGQNSTYNTGKNKWKFRFHRGHLLAMPDNYGSRTTTVRTLNLSSVPAPWAPWNRGMHGLDEAVAFRLSNLAGAPAPDSSYVHWRVIDGAAEAGPTQFDGDFWGLYLAFENTDNEFKDGHGLPDGNIFRLQITGAGNSVLGQGKGQPDDLSDLNAFTSTTNGYRRGGGTATTAPLVPAIQPESWFRETVDLPEYFSWRAVTEAINQTDRREQENVVYFRRPPAPLSDGRWMILPWDCDLLYENFDRWGPQSVQTTANLQQYEQISRALLHPAILRDFRNRARELQDLLLNSDQAWKVIDEFLCHITDESPRIIPPGSPIADGFAEAERRRWDFHPANPVPPRGNSATGNYYKSPYPIGNMTNGPPQPYNRTLATADLEGMVRWIKEFITTATNGGGRLTRMAEGRLAPYTLTATAAITIPQTPTISYRGPAGFPIDQLRFSTSSFAATNGEAFAAIQWRLGEVSDPSVPGFAPGQPWRYEVEGVWTPPPSAAFTESQSVPATGLSPGRTYRARVRHLDAAGNWSHWSAPLQFTASPPRPDLLAASLVISEIMYNPPPPHGSDAEFIELLNIHPTATLDLTGVQFSAGITFAFPSGTSLAPAARIVVVRNPAIFATLHGNSATIAGTFSGSLSNSGELLTLTFGNDTVLRSVPYATSTPWPSAPDNSGTSLVLTAPFSNPDHANPLNWRAATAPNPGSTDSTTFSSWLTTHQQTDPSADTDGDELSALAEYALGGNPGIPSTAPRPTFSIAADGTALVTVSRPLTHDDAALSLEQSTGSAWSPLTAPIVSRQQSGTTESITLAVPPTDSPKRFLRLRFSLP